MSTEKPTTSTSEKPSKPESSKTEEVNIKSEYQNEVVNYFFCEKCQLREQYDYFGMNPPFINNYKILENAYVIEDPFVPQKQGEFIILGSHCKLCNKTVCKDTNCSLYYDGTYCINCAKCNINIFPDSIQQKLNRILL